MDTIKAFLEADAKRTQGRWSKEYSCVITDDKNYNDGTSGWREYMILKPHP